MQQEFLCWTFLVLKISTKILSSNFASILHQSHFSCISTNTYSNWVSYCHFGKCIYEFITYFQKISEQQEYAKERLEWTNLAWSDNTPVIHLLGKKPLGILHLLDDESNFPKASDSSFLEKCHYNHALNESYCRPRVGGREFGVSTWYLFLN